MKILYHTPTQTLVPYPRVDDEPVIGLASDYEVFTVAQEPIPNYDSATHYLRPTQSVNATTKTVTREWDIVENPPPVVTMRSLQLSMTLAQTMAISAAIASMPEGKDKRDARIYWNHSNTVSRSHPVVASFAQMISATNEEVDALFAAAKILDETPP